MKKSLREKNGNKRKGKSWKKGEERKWKNRAKEEITIKIITAKQKGESEKKYCL